MTTSIPASRRAAGRRSARRAPLLLAVIALRCAYGAEGGAAGNNAITAAYDAFGTSVGNQSIGLYSPLDVRGFNPQQSGNLRLDGLYYDQQTAVTSNCQSNESAIRVGLSAQAFSFPSPSGIADLKLAVPGDAATASLVAHRDSLGVSDGLVLTQLPVTARLSAAVCVGYYGNVAQDLDVRDNSMMTGITLRWRPLDGVEMVPFWTRINGSGRGIRPMVYTDGVAPLPLFVERDLAVQSFTSAGWQQTTAGATLHADLPARWRLSAGLFDSQEDDPQSFIEEYLSLATDRSVDHWLDVVPPFLAHSISGEARLEQIGGGATHIHKLVFTIRGRNVSRNFGGDGLVHYDPPVTLDSVAAAGAVAYATSTPSTDRVRQLDGGLGLEERWQGVGSIGLGLLHSNYRRSVSGAAVALTGQSMAASPWLGNARFVIEASAHVRFYGSFVQGLEDSALAPSSNANRGEPLPAMRTRQGDVGLRYAPDGHLTMLVGAFDVHKGYVNSDAQNVYRVLGTLRHRGLEASLTYTDADRGVTLVAGGVRLQAHAERTIAEPGATGAVPLGPVPLVLQANLDYAPPDWQPWAVSLQWKRLSARVQTTDDRFRLPALSTLAAGVRFESTHRGHPWSIRLDGTNLTQAQGLHISPVGLVLPEQSRQVQLTFAIET